MRLKNLIAGAALLAGTTLAASTSFGAVINSGIAAGGTVNSFDGADQHLYQLLGGIGATSLNTAAKVDAAQIHNDQYWSVGATGGSFARMIFEISGYSGGTTFGVYDRNNSSNRVNLWSGSATPGTRVLLEITDSGLVTVNLGLLPGGNFASGNQFGFFITLPDDNNTTYFSDETLNPGGTDQMVAFQGNDSDVLTVPTTFAPPNDTISGTWLSNEYILGWEDLLASLPLGSTDNDYNDLIILVESVRPVPEPATLALLGMGLIGLGVARRRQSKQA